MGACPNTHPYHNKNSFECLKNCESKCEKNKENGKECVSKFDIVCFPSLYPITKI